MKNLTKQQFIEDLEKDLKLKISALKKEQQVFNTLSNLRTLTQDASKEDEVMVILDKLQTFAEKQLAEEIEVYEEALLELQEISGNKKDIETEGMVA